MCCRMRFCVMVAKVGVVVTRGWGLRRRLGGQLRGGVGMTHILNHIVNVLPERFAELSDVSHGRESGRYASKRIHEVFRRMVAGERDRRNWEPDSTRRRSRHPRLPSRETYRNAHANMQAQIPGYIIMVVYIHIYM